MYNRGRNQGFHLSVTTPGVTSLGGQADIGGHPQRMLEQVAVSM